MSEEPRILRSDQVQPVNLADPVQVGGIVLKALADLKRGQVALSQQINDQIAQAMVSLQLVILWAPFLDRPTINAIRDKMRKIGGPDIAKAVRDQPFDQATMTQMFQDLCPDLELVRNLWCVLTGGTTEPPIEENQDRPQGTE